MTLKANFQNFDFSRVYQHPTIEIVLVLKFYLLYICSTSASHVSQPFNVKSLLDPETNYFSPKSEIFKIVSCDVRLISFFT